jgi:RNA polymerase sigma-70 factor (ECF subfamily)
MEKPGVDNNLTREWNEEELIKQAQEDLSKFEPIFDRYFDRVFAFVFSRTNNRQIAEDLTSQIFLKIVQALPRYKNKGSFAAWIFTIARNTLNSHFRSADYRFNDNLDESRISEFEYQNAPRQQFADIENKIDLDRAIKRLTYKDQEILSLRYAAELSYEDIGMILRKKPGAVKMAIHRILRKVKEKMESENENKN